MEEDTSSRQYAQCCHIVFGYCGSCLKQAGTQERNKITVNAFLLNTDVTCFSKRLIYLQIYLCSSLS